MSNSFSSKVPALPLYRIVQQYARAHGLRFLTTLDQAYAFQHYALHAPYWN